MSIVLALLSTACVYFALFKAFAIDWDSLASAFEGADKGILAGTLLFSVLFFMFVGADKLYRVFRALSPLGFDLTYREVLALRMGTGPFRVFLPMDAGEIVNVLFLWRHKKVPVDSASGALVFDKGLNLMGGVFWLIFGLAFLGAKSLETRMAAWLVIGGGYALFFFATPLHGLAARAAGRVHKKLGAVAAGVLAPLGHCTARQKIFFCFYGIFMQARPLLVGYLLFRAFGISPEPGLFITFETLSAFAGHLPTAGGMGPREAVFVISFSSLGPPAVLLAVGMLQSLFVYVIPLLSGLPWSYWVVRRAAGRAQSA